MLQVRGLSEHIVVFPLSVPLRVKGITIRIMHLISAISQTYNLRAQFRYANSELKR